MRRSMPAIVHELELAFEEDGTLKRYRYSPHSALVVVQPDRG